MMNNIEVPKLGIVRGMVVDVDDPLKLCRLKVRVPSIHGMEGSDNYRPDSELPWAYPSLPANMKQVPKVTDFVWVLFENSRIDMPVYMGIVLAKQSADPSKPILLGQGGSTTPNAIPSSYEAPYEGNKQGTVFESAEGFSFTYDDVAGVMTLNKNGTSIKVEDGTATVNVNESKFVVSEEEITLSIGGSSIILTGSGIILKVGGTEINLSGGSLVLKSPVIHENP